MALYPRQNSTFGFDVQFTFYFCCPRFDIRVTQCDIEVSRSNFGPSQCNIRVSQCDMFFRAVIIWFTVLWGWRYRLAAMLKSETRIKWQHIACRMIGFELKMCNGNVAWKNSVVLWNFNVALWNWNVALWRTKVGSWNFNAVLCNSDIESRTTNIKCELNIESESRILAGI